jgi:CHAP domain
VSIASDAMVNAMIACIGAHETNGDNVNFITSWYGEDGQPWCDMTVSYAAYHSNNVSPVCFGFKHDYTVEHAQAFQSRGQWHSDTAGIQRGDIVFFDWNGTNNISAIDHVGVVEFVDADGVHTIEGNIDNVCKRMVRHSDFIAGYGRPLYASDPVPPTPVPNPTPTPVPVLPVVSCAVVRAASSGGPAAPTPVGNVQNALAKLGFITFTNRGDWGPATTAGYQRFQYSLGYRGSDASGHPGLTSLTSLAKKSGLFTAAA